MITPTVSLAKSNAANAIFPRSEFLRKSLISKTLAEATAKTAENGIKIMVGKDNGLTSDTTKRVNGTGENVIEAISALDQMIVLIFNGSVLEYSKPEPSEFSRPKGNNSEKIPPIAVAARITEALNIE